MWQRQPRLAPCVWWVVRDGLISLSPTPRACFLCDEMPILVYADGSLTFLGNNREFRFHTH